MGGYLVDYKNAYALFVEIISKSIDIIEGSPFISLEIDKVKQNLKEALETAEEMYINSK